MRREVFLPANDTAARLARSSLSAALPPPDLLDRGADAQLAVTELAANAVRHGGLRPDDMVRLVIEADDDRVRVEVEQSTSARDVHVVPPRLDDQGDIGGFGLRLVERTADVWGHEAGPPGHVWFEFRRARA